MDPLRVYSIPVRGLREGEHDYQFHLDWRFFRQFDQSPVEKASIDVDLKLDKKSDHMVAEIQLEGKVEAQCDRCLASIELPVSVKEFLIVKYAENVEDEADVVYISREDPSWNVAQYLYEYTTLALPMRNIIDCDQIDPQPCDMNMLERLKPSESKEKENPLWDELKKILK